MSKSVIPPTPTGTDYTQRPDYTAQMEANAVPIFGREDPIALFTEWMAAARDGELNDSNAMSLATMDADGQADVRIVLLKGVDETGFTFFTNANSAKGQQLQECPQAALCFHWKSLRRQVRVRGTVEVVTGEAADAYFASRARGSQIGAWASDQSSKAASRDELEARVKEVEAKYEGRDVPRPPHWHGWKVVPNHIEFWRDRPFRLHDRLQFQRNGNGWATSRLFP